MEGNKEGFCSGDEKKLRLHTKNEKRRLREGEGENLKSRG